MHLKHTYNSTQITRDVTSTFSMTREYRVSYMATLRREVRR